MRGVEGFNWRRLAKQTTHLYLRTTFTRCDVFFFSLAGGKEVNVRKVSFISFLFFYQFHLIRAVSGIETSVGGLDTSVFVLSFSIPNTVLKPEQVWSRTNFSPLILNFGSKLWSGWWSFFIPH